MKKLLTNKKFITVAVCVLVAAVSAVVVAKRAKDDEAPFEMDMSYPEA